jgi:mono/diheme cytochrome c family protein
MLGTAGCAGDGPPPELGGSAFDEIQRTIFNPQCATGSCHVSGVNQGNLNLEAGRSYAELVGVRPANSAAAASGLQRVIPFDPANSFLLIKITNPRPEHGSLMPLGFPALSPSQIDLVRRWIADGAAGPGGPPPPSATPSPSPTASHTPPPSATATSTLTPSVTATASITPTGTLAPTASATRTATFTPTATATATATVPPTPTFNPESTLARLQETIFTPGCAVRFCHDSVTKSANLVLLDGASYAEMVGVAPDNQSAERRGMLLVDPGHPDNSFLLTKVEMTEFDSQLGSPMPLVGNRLTADQIEHLRAWILRGAPESQ